MNNMCVTRPHMFAKLQLYTLLNCIRHYHTFKSDTNHAAEMVTSCLPMQHSFWKICVMVDNIAVNV